MGRKEKKYHYIYKTVNLLSGKYYIGMHSTDNLDDGYLGSGTRLRRSINKHGKENFKREILEFCESRELLKSREIEVICLNEIAKVDCMNLKVGGSGGLSDIKHYESFTKAGINNFNNSKEKRENSLLIKRKDKEWLNELGNKISQKLKDINYNHSTFEGKKHSQETKQKMVESKRGQGNGETNSQFGSCWITNEKENKKIKRGDLLPEGFRLGRKMT